MLRGLGDWETRGLGEIRNDNCSFILGNWYKTTTSTIVIQYAISLNLDNIN